MLCVDILVEEAVEDEFRCNNSVYLFNLLNKQFLTKIQSIATYYLQEVKILFKPFKLKQFFTILIFQSLGVLDQLIKKFSDLKLIYDHFAISVIMSNF